MQNGRISRSTAASIVALFVGACSAPDRVDPGDVDAGPAALDAGEDDASGGGIFIDAAPWPDGGSDAGGESCGNLTAIYRDFRSSHTDFEDFLGDDRGLVKDTLGADGKPVYAPSGPTATVAGAASFDDWYHDVDGVNLRFEQPLVLTEVTPGTFVFEDSEFFPLDGLGWGEEIIGHNFHFTTEIHATFHYHGGEIFTFKGDDDVFVFVNGHLALDLGGVHGPQQATIDFDAQAAQLGITTGQLTSLDVFHAERFTSMSTFRIETSIDCIIVP
jgi:fibro-slime domain-containing protein